MASDAIGDRMKDQYEDRTRFFLPRRTYTILRVDGKAFHSFCRKMTGPYDRRFMDVMDRTAAAMLKELMGAEFAYVQSDEISILLTDFAKPNTEAWFDGNLQKMASVGASMATAYFTSFWGEGMPMFDARLFTIPDHIEVENYFIWRQQDAVRNSILMLGQHYYSPMQMHGKNCAVVQDMIHDKGDNWNDHPARFKRGGLVFYNRGTIPYPSWEIHSECPTFTSEDGRPFLKSLIPIHWAESAAIPPVLPTGVFGHRLECNYHNAPIGGPGCICKPDTPVQDHGPRVDTKGQTWKEKVHALEREADAKASQEAGRGTEEKG